MGLCLMLAGKAIAATIGRQGIAIVTGEGCAVELGPSVASALKKLWL